MYCNLCGKAIPDDANVCAYCAHPVAGFRPRRPLVRPRFGRKVAGVCLGFAEYTDLDVTLVRLLALVLAIIAFPLTEIAYVAAWIIMPEAEVSSVPVPTAAPSVQHQ